MLIHNVKIICFFLTNKYILMAVYIFGYKSTYQNWEPERFFSNSNMAEAMDIMTLKSSKSYLGRGGGGVLCCVKHSSPDGWSAKRSVTL